MEAVQQEMRGLGIFFLLARYIHFGAAFTKTQFTKLRLVRI
jgi:hypothetical protein